MLRFTPLLLLQAFCIYHAYTNKANRIWYFLIIFLPLLGCILYLYYHFVNKQNIQKVSRGLESIVNTNAELERLEKQMAFSDTIQNMTLVADKYVELERYKEAIALYEQCLEGYNANDPETIKKLAWAHYLDENYEGTVQYGNRIKEDKYFLKSTEAVGYAWALFYVGQLSDAESVFVKMDVSFTNYMPRMEYAKFLHESERNPEALSKLEELMDEFTHISGNEKRDLRSTIWAIEQLYREFKAPSS